MPLFGRKKEKIKPLDTTAPDGAGQIMLPNPGEYPADGEEAGIRRNTLGTFPARGHRAGGGTIIGPSEQVAIMRNLEFSAGGRSQLVAKGPVSAATAHVSERTGQVQVSGTEDTTPAAGHADRDQAPQPPPNRDLDISTADGVQAEDRGTPGPERRRDREGL
jgi:hypothetical protein